MNSDNYTVAAVIIQIAYTSDFIADSPAFHFKSHDWDDTLLKFSVQIMAHYVDMLGTTVSKYSFNMLQLQWWFLINSN